MAIPTRFNLGQTPAGRFLELLQPPMGAGARPSARTMTTAPQTRMRGDIPMRLPQQRQRPRMPLEAAILSGTGAMPSAGFVSTPKAPPSIGDKIAGMLPAAGTPEAAGLGAAGTRMLQLSGYSDKPIAMSQILGEAAQAYRTEAKEERRAQQAAELAKQQRETDIALKMMEIRAQQAATERDISGKEFTQEKDLRKEFTAQSKDFTEAKLGFEKVQNAAMSKTPSGATDIALVFGYMKVLDPNSVVREGEFATAANAGGVGETIRNYYNKLLEGTLLTDKVRRQFVSSARTQFQPYLQQQEARETEFTELSDAYSLDPTKVVRSKLPKEGSLARPFIVSTQEEADALPKGSYAMLNGRLGRNN